MRLEMILSSNAVEVQVGNSSPSHKYSMPSKRMILLGMAPRRLLEAGVVARCQEQSNETIGTTASESENVAPREKCTIYCNDVDNCTTATMTMTTTTPTSRIISAPPTLKAPSSDTVKLQVGGWSPSWKYAIENKRMAILGKAPRRLLNTRVGARFQEESSETACTTSESENEIPREKGTISRIDEGTCTTATMTMTTTTPTSRIISAPPTPKSTPTNTVKVQVGNPSPPWNDAMENKRIAFLGRRLSELGAPRRPQDTRVGARWREESHETLCTTSESENDTPRAKGTTICRNDEEIPTTTTTAATTTTNNVTPNVNGSRLGNNTVASPIRTAKSKSLWKNSIDQKPEYIIDPAQGNTYHKGPFLGKGGFASVYLIADVSNGNRYACKIIPKNRMEKIHVERIACEIMIHKALNHVNVVQMHDYFEDKLNGYLLLEACTRNSLMHVLERRGKVTEPEARYYMKQMVSGVAYIHSQKIVHRDLKPGNMFLTDRMIVKIGDFGLAMRPAGRHSRVTICGTPNYIAPEVLHKQACSYEADVWALGCILYVLLVGQPPFDTATLGATYARICSNHYRPVDSAIANQRGQDLIRWLLHPKPEHRPTLERVKEHPYLTKEYVPSTLPDTCCYQMPSSTIIEPTPSPFLVSQSVFAPYRDDSKPVSPNLVPQKVPTHYPQQILPTQQPQLQQQQLQQQQKQQQQQVQLLNRSKKTIQKESKAISWRVRKFPEVPRFTLRLCRNVLHPHHRKTGNESQSVQMQRALEACVKKIKHKNLLQNPPPMEDMAPLFVTKWVDYSNKCGLGFELSDKSVGVLFNDDTQISYTRDRRRVEYVTIDDEIERFTEKGVPAVLKKKLNLLQRFAICMNRTMTDGGEIKKHHKSFMSQWPNICVPLMTKWLRTDKSVVMELTAPLLQVNFTIDHTKIMVSQVSPRKGYLVTYIDTTRRTNSYWLNDLRDYGCTPDLYERLYALCELTREFVKGTEARFT